MSDEVLFGGPAGLGEVVGEIAGVYGCSCSAFPEAEGLGAGVRAEKIEGDAGDPGGDAAFAAEGTASAPDVEEGVLGEGEGEVAVAGGEKEKAEDTRFVESVEAGDVVEGRSGDCALREHVQVSGLEGLLQHGHRCLDQNRRGGMRESLQGRVDLFRVGFKSETRRKLK